MNLIAFDFDKTLTGSDTVLPLCKYLCEKTGRKRIYFKLLIKYFKYRFNQINEKELKNYFCKVLVADYPKEQISQIINQFYIDNQSYLFNDSMINLLKKESANGNECIIVSSNFSFFLEPLKNLLPIKELYGTDAEIYSGRYTGEIVGNICSGEEKWRRAKIYSSEKKFEAIIAYGDSRGDFALLKNADKAYWVKHLYNRKSEKLISILSYFWGNVYKSKSKIKITSFEE